MATRGNQDLEMMEKTMRLFTDHLLHAQEYSKGTAENLAQLAYQVKSSQKDLLTYIGEGIKLRGVMKEVANAVATKPEEAQARVAKLQDSVAQSAHRLQTEEKNLAKLTANASREWREHVTANVQAVQKNLNSQEKMLKLEEARLEMTQRVHALTGKTVALEYLVIRGFVDAIKRSGQLNEALIQANSLTERRKDLSQAIYDVQAKTGTSFDNMLQASRALTAIWPKFRGSVKSTLEVMVQMQEGLGVSYENSAEMARIFEINLNTSAREVADQIAVIANNTSLMADEATRFATEIGKALRLLGPGVVPAAKEVAGFVTTMAGRMKDVGGDANEIVKMFSEMTGGTQQAFMLRALSGVNTPGALGTQAGAQAALQGIGRFINSVVTARSGTMAYAAQLEVAAQMTHLSTQSVELYANMLRKAREPLDEHAKLEQRWREQINQANQAIGRIKESFVALIQRAFTPFVPIATAVFGAIAKFVSFLASNRLAIGIVSVAVVAGTMRAIYVLGRLAFTLYEVTAAALAATRAEQMEAAAKLGGGVGGAGRLGGLLSKLTGQLPWLSTIGTWVTRIGKMILSPALEIALAGAVGVGVGLLIDKLMDKLGKWSMLFFPVLYGWKKLTEKIANSLYHTQLATGHVARGKTSWEIMADVRKAMVQGRSADVESILREGRTALIRQGAIKDSHGLEAYRNLYLKTSAQAREQIGMATVTSGEKQTLENDKKQIELAKQQVDIMNQDIRLAQQREAARQRKEDERAQAENTRYMINYVQFRLQPQNQIPSKVTLSPGGFLKAGY